MAIKYVNFKSRYFPKTKVPEYTNMVVCDIYQQENDEILIGECPQAANIYGIGKYNVSARAGTTLSDKAEVYVTLASKMLIESEAALNVTEANSAVVWHFAGNQASNSGVGEGYFEISSPWTYMKIKFIGLTGTGAKVSFAVN
jgi:hypothetical protein